MKALPKQLAPWHPWLSLFPLELAEPLGAMMLRLHRVVGPLRSAPARTDCLPEGVGSIVQRGPYQRMLMTEWVYADAEPDEFIRRAAGGELLFTGPEPAARRRSRRCVVLFDAGPLQLGEPRLLHLALFILLARRAEEAGATFAWGVLQRPGVLSTDSGASAVVDMLRARSASALVKESKTDWDAVLDYTDDDVWLIGATGAPLLPQARTQVTIRHALLAPQIDVTLTTQRDSSTVSLPLPAADIGTRLLREPFNATATSKTQHVKSTRPSLQLAPVFSLADSRLGVPMVDGSVVIYHIPKSSRTKPAKPRTVLKANQRGVLGVAIYAKSAAIINSQAGNIVLTGFPGALSGKANSTFERPPMEQFNVAANAGRWLPVFHQRNRGSSPVRGMVDETRVLTVDLRGQLVCFSTSGAGNPKFASSYAQAFQPLAQHVIGAVQFDEDILFATCDGPTEIHRLAPDGTITRLASLRDAQQVLFGDARSWRNGATQGLLALRYSETEWIVSRGHTSFTTSVNDKSAVLGVAYSYQHNHYGLIVITPARKSINLHTANELIVLLTSDEEIQHAVVNPRNGQLAWVGRHSFRISAKGLDDQRPTLDVVVEYQTP